MERFLKVDNDETRVNLVVAVLPNMGLKSFYLYRCNNGIYNAVTDVKTTKRYHVNILTRCQTDKLVDRMKDICSDDNRHLIFVSADRETQQVLSETKIPYIVLLPARDATEYPTDKVYRQKVDKYFSITTEFCASFMFVAEKMSDIIEHSIKPNFMERRG